MIVDYNKIAEKFASSRKDMKWEELEYFFSLLSPEESILDIACGSGRFLEQYKIYFWNYPFKYIGIDLSQELLLEAQKVFPELQFIQGNMLRAWEYIAGRSFENIFCIAGLHHLETLEERKQALKDWYKILPVGGKIYMTNWALESPINAQKYDKYSISEHEDRFFSSNYMIPFWEYLRYYHCFSLKELEYIADEAGFHILENRLFETEKNFVTLLQK